MNSSKEMCPSLSTSREAIRASSLPGLKPSPSCRSWLLHSAASSSLVMYPDPSRSHWLNTYDIYMNHIITHAYNNRSTVAILVYKFIIISVVDLCKQVFVVVPPAVLLHTAASQDAELLVQLRNAYRLTIAIVNSSHDCHHQLGQRRRRIMMCGQLLRMCSICDRSRSRDSRRNKPIVNHVSLGRRCALSRVCQDSLLR